MSYFVGKVFSFAFHWFVPSLSIGPQWPSRFIFQLLHHFPSKLQSNWPFFPSSRISPHISSLQTSLGAPSPSPSHPPLAALLAAEQARRPGNLFVIFRLSSAARTSYCRYRAGKQVVCPRTRKAENLNTWLQTVSNNNSYPVQV